MWSPTICTDTKLFAAEKMSNIQFSKINFYLVVWRQQTGAEQALKSFFACHGWSSTGSEIKTTFAPRRLSTTGKPGSCKRRMHSNEVGGLLKTEVKTNRCCRPQN